VSFDDYSLVTVSLDVVPDGYLLNQIFSGQGIFFLEWE
jgi:hypothetical protein